MRKSLITRSRSLAARALGVALLLVPLIAHAEEQDLGDIIHALVVLAMIGVIFLGTLGFGIWVLVLRLRSKDIPDRSLSSSRPRPQLNFEGLWFPNAAAAAPLSSSRSRAGESGSVKPL